MNEKEIKEVIDLTKTVLKVMIEDEELSTLIAKNTKKIYDAYLAEGFTATQATDLTAAHIKAQK